MGILALVGGDEFRPNCLPMDRDLLRYVTHSPPRVLILPTAAARQGPELAARNGVRYFQALGAQAEPLMVLSRDDAASETTAARVHAADLLYLTGGDPGYLLDVLRTSRLWEAMRSFYEAGGMLAGSSAGAMALGGWMRWGPGGGWVEALGLAPSLAVMPHYTGGGGAADVTRRGSLDAGVALLGIPTATACVSATNGAEWQVVGAAPVAVLTSGTMRQYTPGERFSLPRSTATT